MNIKQLQISGQELCINYSVEQNGVTYGDWYLPSNYELNLMYTNKATIDAIAGANSGNSFASYYYWSSTEYGVDSAWLQTFADGSQVTSLKSAAFRVRAVRAF